jgi:hypothetical protein
MTGFLRHVTTLICKSYAYSVKLDEKLNTNATMMYQLQQLHSTGDSNRRLTKDFEGGIWSI